MPQNGLKMGSFHPFVHPKWSRMRFRKMCFWGRLKRSATIWASGRTRDPYFEILGAPRGIMVTRSGGFEF